MIVLRSLAPTTVLVMDSASMEFVPARTVGVELIVLVVVLDTVNAAVETANALRVNVIATLVGPVMLVTFELACMIAHNTDIATMEPASAKRDTEDEIVHFHLSPNLANAPFTVSVVVFNNAQRCMRPKELVLRMSATPRAHKNAFLSVSQERCPSI
jgi:hypothetical protein